MKNHEPCTRQKVVLAAAVALLTVAVAPVQASSHREAPAITETPKVDGTDFYMFRSYEEGRGDFVTLIANYVPLQDSYGGPNYFALDQNARYAINVDNDGDARPDMIFRFNFNNEYQNIAVPSGPDAKGHETTNTVPVLTTVPGGIGPDAGQTNGLNRLESYSVHVTHVGSHRDSDFATNLGNAGGDGAGTTTFRKPVDNIGEKSINDYAAYANDHIYGIELPGCKAEGARVFVGQRREGFVVNLGEVFDLINTDPLGPRDAELNILDDKNVTSIALEVPIECLTSGDDPVIGAWTSSYLPKKPLSPSAEVPQRWQVSRLGSPLVNEVVIGLDRKDAFNASRPAGDLADFASFVTNPTLPVLVEALFGVPAPATPRIDLVQAFVTGIPGFTQPAAIANGHGRGGEMLRLNTAFPEAPTPLAEQQDLGFLACDLTGFPNGRRPIDDVVDIELTVVEGAITADNPNGLQTCDLSGESPTVVNAGAVVTDGARPSHDDYLSVFPYLNTPLGGSPAMASTP